MSNFFKRRNEQDGPDPDDLSGFGKIEEPKRRYEQRQICWCGDPSCPGGLAGRPEFSASETTSSRGKGMSSLSGYERERAIEQMMRIAREQMLGGAFRSYPGISPMADERPSASAAYSEARERVKDLILEVKHETGWDEVVGNEDAKRALFEAIEEPKNNAELYEFYGMKPPKGVLLYGPPGCGKTMFAKAAAAAIGRVYGAKSEVVLVNGPTIQSPYVGKTEEKIRDIFAYAREYQKQHKHPLTVFFDEAEVLFPDRTGRARRVAPWEQSQVAQFLSEMDGLNSLGAFVILATNRPEAIDEALLRDGRCDRKIKVIRPTREAVEHILRKSFASLPLAEDVEALVVAGSESFFNPHYVIHEGHILGAMVGKDGPQFKDIAINFCLEHIVSGAMVAGVARRAKSRAFLRDVNSKAKSGISSVDVIDSVKEIFDENKGLEHAFAIREWFEALPVKEMLEPKGRMQ